MLQPVYESALGRLYRADCLAVLPEVEDSSVDLVFADPPFNLGKDYGEGLSDSLNEQQYLKWCGQWIDQCVRILKPGGAFYLYNLPRWNIELGHQLNELGMMFRHWIAVDIKFSLPIPGRLYPSHYSLLYHTKGKPRTFRRPRIPVPVCRHCGGDIKDYGGHRNKLHPDGLNLTDVWLDIPPVRHASTKRRGANELSIKLLRRILEISTKPGDLVLDPFGGSGTTYAAAEEMHRHWVGIELGDTDAIIRRLKGEKADVPPKNLGDSGKGMTAERRARANGSSNGSAGGDLRDAGHLPALPIVLDSDHAQEPLPYIQCLIGVTPLPLPRSLPGSGTMAKSGPPRGHRTWATASRRSLSTLANAGVAAKPPASMSRTKFTRRIFGDLTPPGGLRHAPPAGLAASSGSIG